MTLNIKKLDGVPKGKYVCNFCGRIYDAIEAYHLRGNYYLCSKECVLEYDKLYNPEK